MNPDSLETADYCGGSLNSSEEWFQNTAVSVSGFTGFL